MKTRRISFATAAIALTLAASSAIAGTSQGWENGGKFVNFDPVIAAYNRSGDVFRIVGQCNSACTRFLSIRNMCVERTAVFGFHAGNDGKGNISENATRHMQNAYNEKLRRFVIENRYMETFTFHTISGNDIIDKFGYRACTEQDRILEAKDRSMPGKNHGNFAENPQNLNHAGRGTEGSFAENSRRPLESMRRGAEGSFKETF